jgi:hypothetical protein
MPSRELSSKFSLAGHGILFRCSIGIDGFYLTLIILHLLQLIIIRLKIGRGDSLINIEFSQ